MLISIIIPIYNTENYLKKCFDSIIKHIDRKEHIEVILVIDGSTDNSVNICNEYCSLYLNIKLIIQENQGLSAARNAGIKEAKGKYLAFIDSDDYVNDKFKDAIDFVARNLDIDVFMFNYNRICKDKTILEGINHHLSEKKYTVDDNLRYLLFKYTQGIYPAFKFIVSKEFILKNDLYFRYGFLHEDIDWSIKIMISMKTFRYSTINWYEYISERPGSIMNTRSYKSLLNIITISKDLINYAKLYENAKVRRTVCILLSKTCFGTLRYYKKLNDADKILFLDLINANLYLFSISNALKHKIFYCFMKIAGVKNSLNILSKGQR